MGSEPKVIKKRKYGINKLDFIRQALAGYAGGSAIISEMLQNADDAGATRSLFQFRPKDFLAWNDSKFSPQDWDNLTNIASGGKHEQIGKIGTWGTGFLSVFHLTDIPEVISAGEKLILDPREDDAVALQWDDKGGTGFRMEWRRESSEISHAIEADVWNDENIQTLKDELAVSIYRQIIFLRNVNSIEVYEGNRWQEKPLYKVTRTLKSFEQKNDYRCEQWEIEYQRAGAQTRLDSWLYYKGNVPDHLMVDGVKPKDTQIGIAFPVKNKNPEWLTKNLPGTLYNFLPTPIETGYNFQINGAFFPDNNRRTILIDPQTQRDKSRWNLNVIDAIGDLFVEVICDIRERLTDPRRFYEILPTQPPPQSADFLKAIYKLFCDAAPKEEIVFSSLGKWSQPGKVSIGRPGSRLPELVAEYLPIVPSGVPQTFRDFLIYTLKIPTIEWKDAIKFLDEDTIPGTPLVNAHPMINSAEKLGLLYSELPNNPPDEQRKLFVDVAICLGADDKLWPFSADIWRASEQTRSLLSNTNLLFVSLEVQKQYPKLFENLLVELQGAELVEWLAKQQWPDTAIDLPNLPTIFENLDHLIELIEFIYTDLQRTSRDLLRKLPIVYTEDGFLCTAESKVYFHKDAAERSDLQPFGLQFVHPDWVAKEVTRTVYERSEIRDLAPRNLIQLLREHPLTQSNLSHTELCQQLLKIYGYFSRNKSQIDDVSKVNLLSMPLCLTQRFRLTSVQEERDTLHLPGDESLSKSPALKSLDKLQLDNLIHSDVLAGRSFLTQVLGIRPLSEVDLIRDVILMNYHDQRLNNVDRRNLLFYISEQLRTTLMYQQNQLWPDLLTAELIFCSNGEYHAAEQVYFASPAIDAVFASGYLKLHSDYQVHIPLPDENDQAPYRQSTWYWLFDHLHVNEAPAASDLLKTIKRLTAINPPADGYIKSVQRLYDFLNREITNNKVLANSPDLSQLAEVAWFPARNHSDRWYRPAEIYQASLGELIGDQAPIMHFGESAKEFRSLFGMPSYPQAEIVARHLLELSEHKQPLSALRIYVDLGQRWSEIPEDLRQELKTKEIVWSSAGKRFWKPNQVFLGNFNHLFGKRRSYMEAPGSDAQIFLTNIGVREEPHAWNDSIDLISEIANDYPDSHVVEPDDMQMILLNLEAISQFDQAVQDRLKIISFVPNNNSQLFAPHQIILVDRKELLTRFEDTAFPHVYQELLNPSVCKLLRKLGLPLLSELVGRKLVKVPQNSQIDTMLSNQIRLLEDPFKRVASGFYKRDEAKEIETYQKIENLIEFQILACDQIEVEYFINNFNGQNITSHAYENEKSLLDESTKCLYVRRVKGNLDNVQLSLEIANLLFPDSKNSIVIESLLEKKSAEIDEYLDHHEYPKLMKEGMISPPLPVSTASVEVWVIPEKLNGENEATPLGGEKTETKKTSDGFIQPQLPKIESTPPTNTRTLIPEKVEPKAKPEIAIPIFTGDIRPSVPVISNNYGELQKRYGLKLDSDYPDDDSAIFIPHHIEAEDRGESKKDVEKEFGEITSTRFTLTFLNRYKGFLTLYQRAKQMLADHPTRLVCKTDFPEWEFDLFVDYERQIIYNEEILPQFFEAFNIPAGGIIYLERVHGNQYRMFWKQAASQVEKVICLELLEDGTWTEYEIPSTNFSCELSEYVFRSEKRLEDIEALTRQAIGKNGIFQTICDVFGEPNKVLSFDEIFKAVMKIRQVAQASIYYQLNQRPCFVQLDDTRWRFEPLRGTRKEQEKEKSEEPNIQEPIKTKPGSKENSPDVKDKNNDISASNPKSQSSPISLLMSDMRRDWLQLNELFQNNNHSEQESLYKFVEKMRTFADQWQQRLQMLAEDDGRVDETIQGLWDSFSNNPGNEQKIKLVEQRIWELTTSRPANGVIAQLQVLLTGTQDELRPIFHKLISDIANRSFEKELFAQSLQLYQLLESQGAGSFKGKIDKIGEQQNVQARLIEFEQEKGTSGRLTFLQLAWEETPNFPTLRRVILNEVKQSTTEQEKLIQLCIDDNQTDEAYNIFTKWSILIWPLSSAWENDVVVTANIWELTRRIFQMLYNAAYNFNDTQYYYLALRFANTLPVNIQHHISGADYVAVILEVAHDMENKDDMYTAAGILQFGLYLLGNSQREVDKYLKYQANEYLMRLFEQLELYQYAKYHSRIAVDNSSTEHRNQVQHRRHSLLEKVNNLPGTEKSRELETWNAHLKRLSDREIFQPLIEIREYEEFIDWVQKIVH
ncbi:MAG: hypothetical protein WCK35_17595 [Chloroflexota bacterium]